MDQKVKIEGAMQEIQDFIVGLFRTIYPVGRWVFLRLYIREEMKNVEQKLDLIIDLLQENISRQK